MSRLRANEITNRMANGAPTVSNGLVISGVVTATSFSGSGANLTSLPSPLVVTDGNGTVTTGGNYINLKRTSANTNYINAPLADAELHISADENIIFKTVHTGDFNSTERLRIGNSGQIGLGGANYGTSGQVLTSQGSGSAVQWATPSNGLNMVDSWRLNSALNNTQEADLTSNWVRNSDSPISGGYPHMGAIGSAMTESSGVFSFPSTGIYLIKFHCTAYATSGRRFFEANIIVTRDNFSTSQLMARGYNNGYDSSNSTYWTSISEGLFDVKNSNHKVKFNFSSSANCNIQGSNYNLTYVTFMRLGDT
tara:strand:- start:54 stop:980 length:927 start_codon:yes stop_codon:yes gene_type:complete